MNFQLVCVMTDSYLSEETVVYGDRVDVRSVKHYGNTWPGCLGMGICRIGEGK